MQATSRPVALREGRATRGAEHRDEVSHRGAAGEGDGVDVAGRERGGQPLDVRARGLDRAVGDDLVHHAPPRARSASGSTARRAGGARQEHARARSGRSASARTSPSARNSSGTISGRSSRPPELGGGLGTDRPRAARDGASRTSRPAAAKRAKNARTPLTLVKNIQS
jgi:hypothetical protein